MKSVVHFANETLEIDFPYPLASFATLAKDENTEILNWRNDEATRAVSLNKEIISSAEHLEFVQRLITDKKLLFVKVDDIGVVSLSRIDLVSKSALLGIYANPAKIMAGRGPILMQAILKIGFEALSLNQINLEVFEMNTKAVHLFKRSGFEVQSLDLSRIVTSNSKLLKMFLSREKYFSTRVN